MTVFKIKRVDTGQYRLRWVDPHMVGRDAHHEEVYDDLDGLYNRLTEIFEPDDGATDEETDDELEEEEVGDPVTDEDLED